MTVEKYQQIAAEELSRNKRKPDIWARAIALAAHDHTKARTLYAQMRVDQLQTNQNNKKVVNDKQLLTETVAPAVAEQADTAVAEKPVAALETLVSELIEEAPQAPPAASPKPKKPNAPLTMEANPLAFLAQQHQKQQKLDQAALEGSAKSSKPIATGSSNATSHTSQLGDISFAPGTMPGSGNLYYVYSKPDQIVAVKNGVSWGAMLMTLPWLLSKQLFGTALVYTLLAVILVAGLAVSGLAWFDAGMAADPILKAWTGLFAATALITLFYVPWRYGNEWLQQKLTAKRFDLDGVVYAKNRPAAINTLHSAQF